MKSEKVNLMHETSKNWLIYVQRQQSLLKLKSHNNILKLPIELAHSLELGLSQQFVYRLTFKFGFRA